MPLTFKPIFINYILMSFVIFGIILVQSTFWSFFISRYIPLLLWLPFLVYWSLFRGTWETIFIIYLLSVSLATTSTVPVSYFLLTHLLFFIILITFKKFYYTNRTFFSLACALSFIFLPIFLGILSILKEGSSFFPPLMPWMTGGILSWFFAWPLFYLLKWLDDQTLSSKDTL